MSASAQSTGGSRSGSIRRRIERTIAIAIILTAVLFVAVGLTLRQALDLNQALLDQVDTALLEVGEIELQLAEQQAAGRAFVLTDGGETFKRANELARDQANTSLDELDRLTEGLFEDGSDEREAIRALRGAAEEWRAAPVQLVLVDMLGIEEITPQLVLQSDVVFDRIEIVAARADEVLRDQRRDLRVALNERTRRLAIAVFITGIVLLGVAVWLWRSLLRDVLVPMQQLADRAYVVASGDIDRTVEIDGPPELQALASDVEAMRLGMRRGLDEARQAAQELEAKADELREQARELESSNAELERFAYVASHDLQEPLRKVASFCELLQRRYADELDERAQTYIDFAVDGAHRMQELIQDLLEFSRVGRKTQGKEQTDLGDLAAEAVNLLSGRIEEADATVTVADGMPTIPVERRLLGQVFQNLVGNAIKFRQPDRPPVVRIDAQELADHWQIAVSDNGIGIEAEYADRVFELFQRLHERDKYEGTGIGLALSRKIVEFHRGTIAVDTQYSGGTRIVFTLAKHDDGPTGPDQHTNAAAADIEGSGTDGRAAPTPPGSS